MLEYLIKQVDASYPSLGTLVTTTHHANTWDDWSYQLRDQQLHYSINENYEALERMTFACPPRPLALSLSNQGLLLLTSQGYYYLKDGRWLVTHNASVAQFFSEDGHALYREPCEPMSPATESYFHRPDSRGALTHARQEKERR
jgi:hypothetical protein